MLRRVRDVLFWAGLVLLAGAVVQGFGASRGWAGFAKWSGLWWPLVLVVVSAPVLGQTVFGRFQFATTVTTMLALGTDLGLGLWTTRELARSLGSFDTSPPPGPALHLEWHWPAGNTLRARIPVDDFEH